MDTPIYKNAAAHTSHAPQAIPPVYPAEMTAQAICDLIDEPKAETIVGGAGKMLVKTHALAPTAFEKSFATFIDRNHFSDEPAQKGSGALFGASKHAASHSGSPTVPLYTDAVVTGVTALAAAALTFMLVRKLKS
jgi:hypothetical protein